MAAPQAAEPEAPEVQAILDKLCALDKKATKSAADIDEERLEAKFKGMRFCNRCHHMDYVGHKVACKLSDPCPNYGPKGEDACHLPTEARKRDKHPDRKEAFDLVKNRLKLQQRLVEARTAVAHKIAKKVLFALRHLFILLPLNIVLCRRARRKLALLYIKA